MKEQQGKNNLPTANRNKSQLLEVFEQLTPDKK